MIITIDGPAASGKSTVAREVARKLNLFYIASGGLYRGLSYVLLHHFGYSLETIDNPLLVDLQEALNPARFKYAYNNTTGEQIFFDSVDISAYLKTSIIDSAASKMAESKIVHELLIEYQRLLADTQDIIIDGRNCGSQVFPNADIKIYLTASLAVRAARLQTMQLKKGVEISLEQAEQQLAQRDLRDSQRPYAPLIKPAHSITLDNSNMSAEQTVQEIMEVIKKKH